MYLVPLLAQGAVLAITLLFLDDVTNGAFSIYEPSSGLCRFPSTDLAVYIAFDATLCGLACMSTDNFCGEMLITSLIQCYLDAYTQKLSNGFVKNAVYKRRTLALGYIIIVLSITEYLLLAVGELIVLFSQFVIGESGTAQGFMLQAFLYGVAFLLSTARSLAIVLVRRQDSD